jgi:hypothetical protein
VDWKKSNRPSADMLGVASTDGLLTGGPRFTGSDQGSSVVLRLVIHRSLLPIPPGRLEQKTSNNPSAEMLGDQSRAELLIVFPR